MSFCSQALAFQSLPFIARRRAWLRSLSTKNAHVQTYRRILMVALERNCRSHSSNFTFIFFR